MMKQILSQIFILFAAIGLLTTGCAKILFTWPNTSIAEDSTLTLHVNGFR
ncbi:uncharacterized protein METZ01_LOCUS500322 [marine metagenome]|uniref:Lipoprotein n=1 Tax=marine metagenome TaxID=408172 RepID=A0A383DUF8_9ZZZZ